MKYAVNIKTVPDAEHWLSWRWGTLTGFSDRRSKISKTCLQTTLYCRQRNIRRFVIPVSIIFHQMVKLLPYTKRALCEATENARMENSLVIMFVIKLRWTFHTLSFPRFTVSHFEPLQSGPVFPPLQYDAMFSAPFFGSGADPDVSS